MFPLPELVYLGWTYIVVNGVILFTKPKEEKKSNEDPATYLDFTKSKQLEYNYIKASPYQLLVGYDVNSRPLFADMDVSPHVLIAGLSKQGKSGCMKQMIKNLSGANYVVLNGFRDDFEEAIIGKDIYEYLKTLWGNLVVQEKPLYIFVDEMMTLDKESLGLIEKILSNGRHYNIFIVGSVVRPAKKTLDMKDLFNVGISFKQRDDSNYRLLFNTGIDVMLRPREFAMISDDLYYGETYLMPEFEKNKSLVI